MSRKKDADVKKRMVTNEKDERKYTFDVYELVVTDRWQPWPNLKRKSKPQKLVKHPVIDKDQSCLTT